MDLNPNKNYRYLLHNNMKFWAIFCVTLATTSVASLSAQNIEIRGLVRDAATNEAIPGAAVKLLKTNAQATADSAGNFVIQSSEAGFFILSAEKAGYKTGYSSEMLFTYDKSPFVTIDMEPEGKSVGKAVVTRSALQKRNAESPVSAQQLSIREIERNPGGNRDISKIVQSLPGVISIPGFRNDIIIRGGAPVENKFYLDGIEIPVINHFQTQGSTGGPVGVLNVNFIKDVNFYTGAFPVNLANGMSAVVDFRQMDGNTEKPKFRFTLGSSDLGFTADGPIGKNVTFIASARQSYLQGLFTLLKLPFLPNFIDYQAKVQVKMKGNRSLTFVGLGAIDYFKLNLKVNEGITDSQQLKNNRYILGNLPAYGQQNYTVGAIYTQFKGKSKQQLFLSRSYLKNSTFKYRDNDDSKPENKILDYNSTESENKMRFEHSTRKGGISLMGGGAAEYANYTVNVFQKFTTPFGVQSVNFDSKLGLVKYGLFGRAGTAVGNGILLNAGLRFDGSNYNSDMAALWRNPSLSLSASIPLADNWYFNANAGQFRQLPTYTVLGYRDSNNVLANKARVNYIVCRQAVAGFQWNKGTDTRVTIEGFYKRYSGYPFALRDSISLGNLGADFTVVGNEPVANIGRGQAYGAEFLVQRRSRSGLYGILSYTLAWSFFEDKNGNLVASAWDSRHTLSLTGGYKLKRNWEIGAKWRLVTGRPFTPVDEANSLLKSNWDVRGQALSNFGLLNTGRLSNFNQFDIRVDKVWYFKKASLNLYLDIQNLFNTQYVGPATLIAAQNADGSLVTDPTDPTRYKADYLPNTSGLALPTIGIILDF